MKLMSSVLETLEKQFSIIRLQSEIINTLSLQLLQNGMMTESDLEAIKTAAMMQESLGGD